MYHAFYYFLFQSSYYFCLLIIERFLLFMFFLELCHIVSIFPETSDLKSDLLKIQHKQNEVETDILRLKTNVTSTHYYHTQQIWSIFLW